MVQKWQRMGVVLARPLPKRFKHIQPSGPPVRMEDAAWERWLPIQVFLESRPSDPGDTQVLFALFHRFGKYNGCCHKFSLFDTAKTSTAFKPRSDEDSRGVSESVTERKFFRSCENELYLWGVEREAKQA
jgi:hypothetical protein